MLDKIFTIVKKPAKWGMIGTLLAAALFTLLVNAGNFGGGFMPVLGRLFVLVIEVAIWACVPVLILVNKEDIARKLFVPILFYWYVSTVIGFFLDAGWARSNVIGLFVASGVFEFFLGLAFLGMVAVYVLGQVKKNAFLIKIAFCIFAGSFLFLLIAFALHMAMEARWESPWNDYFDVILTYLLLPVGIFFAMLYFYPPKTEEIAAEQPVEAEKTAEEPVAAEPEAEAAAAEEPAVEEPAQEETAEPEIAEEPAAEEPATEEPATETPAEDVAEDPAPETPVE